MLEKLIAMGSHQQTQLFWLDPYSDFFRDMNIAQKITAGRDVVSIH